MDNRSEVTVEVGGEHNVAMMKAVRRNFTTDFDVSLVCHELKGDTITIPTDAQLLSVLRASRGDSFNGHDATTAELEARVANLCGKEAGLFCSSGTMANQIAVRTSLHQPPYSVILDHRAHAHRMEAGGMATISQAMTLQVIPSNSHHLTVADIEPQLCLGDEISIAPTKLICLENTLAGTVYPQDEIIKISALAKRHGIVMHLDGARLWHAAAKILELEGKDLCREENLQTVMTALAAPFDSASVCLSKGIGAPIGSILVGSREFIKRAGRIRKCLGGAMRQSGSIAAMADYAITHHFPRLPRTHTLAERLAGGLKELGCLIMIPVETNMVFFDPTPIGLTLSDVRARLQALPDPIIIARPRCVIHHQTSPQTIEDFIECVREMKLELEGSKQTHGQAKEAVSLTGY